MKSFLALAAVAFLSACAATPPPVVVTRDVVVQVQIPPTLQTCSVAPAVPYPAHRQSTVSRYIVDLWAAWRNCSQTLGAVVGAVQAQEGASMGAPASIAHTAKSP